MRARDTQSINHRTLMLLRNRHGSCRGEEAEVVVAVAVVVVMVAVAAEAAMAMMAAASSSLSGQTSQQLKAIVVFGSCSFSLACSVGFRADKIQDLGIEIWEPCKLGFSNSSKG